MASVELRITSYSRDLPQVLGTHPYPPRKLEGAARRRDPQHGTPTEAHDQEEAAMSEVHEGGCLCGSVRYRTTGAPDRQTGHDSPVARGGEEV
jgi:hypothetical protein